MAIKKGFDMQAVLAGVEIQAGNKKKPRLRLATDLVAHNMLSFGIPSIDSASNANGHPRGEILEIFGRQKNNPPFHRIFVSYDIEHYLLNHYLDR